MKPVSIIFLNEGDLGQVLGPSATEGTLRSAMGPGSVIAPRFVQLASMGPRTLRAATGVKVFGPLDLDLQSTRWHLIQAARARLALALEVRRNGPAEALHVTYHTIALGLGREMIATPTALYVDTTVWGWRSMGIWLRLFRHSRAAMWGSIVLERRAFARAAVVLATTGWARDQVLAEAPGTRVKVLHPGIDLERYRPVERPPSARVRILFVGARFTAKGGHDLLTALAPRLGRDVELDIVTREPVGLVSNGVRVHLDLGPHDPALVDLFRHADIFCMPTLGDACPGTVIEAMGCGAAVISTRVGAIPELLDEGCAGVLVDPADPAGLRVALDRLLEDPARRAELGAAARARCEECYDTRKQVPELLATLVEIARPSGARAGRSGAPA